MSRGYKLNSDGDVEITLSPSDYQYLTMCLGMVVGAAAKDNDQYAAYSALALANRVNAGNPEWTPYEIPEELTKCEQS